ncbi:MAG: hypothetical protein ACQKBT_04180, partial [Puniceicoccales bacterium]
MHPLICFLLLCASCYTLVASEPGVTVNYQLPVSGPLPKTYLVTLAITDPDNPDWIISTFVSGQPRTVTEDNQGHFSDIWDGLDENYMPVPPGTYGVKGIYSEAHFWPVDDEWHSITPKYTGGISGWLPDPENPQHWQSPIPFGGDPVNQPLVDIDVGDNGVAVFYYKYLENGLNNPMIDLNQPVNDEQFLRAFNSGGAAGGFSVTTDGETVWATGEEGGPRFLYRADQKPFGKDQGAHRKRVTVSEGKVTSIDSWTDPSTGKSYLYASLRGKWEIAQDPRHKYGKYEESTKDRINQITTYDGSDGAVLNQVAIENPQKVVSTGESLYVLHQENTRWQVSRIAVKDGLPFGSWATVFAVPPELTPEDLELDSTGRFYLSDPNANKVFQLSETGEILRSFGRLAEQNPGTYDPLTLMSPQKLATWQDHTGKDRLIIIEADGPNRASEWDVDTGELIREFPTYQTKANSGYAIDPEHPTHFYIPGQNDWITRYLFDYKNHEWTIDAVWPGVPSGQRKGMEKPVAIRANNGTLYLASERHLLVYRLSDDGKRWIKSAGIVSRDQDLFLWHDANGNGQVEDEELRPTELPGKVLTYHGQRFLPDLSYIAPAQHGRDVWRLAPSYFDDYGNPVYEKWERVLTDPIFEARANGDVDAL